MGFSLPQTLAKHLVRNLAKNLVKNLANNLVKNLVVIVSNEKIAVSKSRSTHTEIVVAFSIVSFFGFES